MVKESMLTKEEKQWLKVRVSSPLLCVLCLVTDGICWTIGTQPAVLPAALPAPQGGQARDEMAQARGGPRHRHCDGPWRHVYRVGLSGFFSRGWRTWFSSALVSLSPFNLDSRLYLRVVVRTANDLMYARAVARTLGQDTYDGCGWVVFRSALLLLPSFLYIAFCTEPFSFCM
jgi:hypothetical protein